MLQGVIFDMDGTLLDTMYYWEHVGEDFLRKIGKTPEPGLGQAMLSMTLTEGATYLREHYSLDMTVEEVMAGTRAVCDDFYRETADFKPGAREFMSRLKEDGIPMVLATATDRDQVELVMKRLGVLDSFAGILTSGEVGNTKAQPDIYLQAAALMGVAPEHTWVFEDAIHAAATAKRAGFRLVGIYDDTSAAVEAELRGLADYYIYDFLDFDGFFRFTEQA